MAARNHLHSTIKTLTIICLSCQIDVRLKTFRIPKFLGLQSSAIPFAILWEFVGEFRIPNKNINIDFNLANAVGDFLVSRLGAI